MDVVVGSTKAWRGTREDALEFVDARRRRPEDARMFCPTTFTVRSVSAAKQKKNAGTRPIFWYSAVN